MVRIYGYETGYPDHIGYCTVTVAPWQVLFWIARTTFGIDAGMLPHHENWREFPVMVSVRFTPLRCAESAKSVAAELIDLDNK